MVPTNVTWNMIGRRIHRREKSNDVMHKQTRDFSKMFAHILNFLSIDDKRVACIIGVGHRVLHLLDRDWQDRLASLLPKENTRVRQGKAM